MILQLQTMTCYDAESIYRNLKIFLSGVRGGRVSRVKICCFVRLLPAVIVTAVTDALSVHTRRRVHLPTCRDMVAP